MYNITAISQNATVSYAAEELQKYLRMMCAEADVKISYDTCTKDGFRLGLMQDLGLDVSDVEDAELDDVVYLDCDERGGIIAGSNPRSVLIAVYEYLRQNGCRWLFPGTAGEYIPTNGVSAVKHRHKASCRFRGQCIEGATFQDQLLETIEFMPKVGMNAFMIQFFSPAVFYKRYYEHQLNEENRKPGNVSDGQVMKWRRQCEYELEKRGMMLHDIGHGWTAKPFGINVLGGWAKLAEDEILPEESRQYLAEINGRRGINRAPSWTNICMSNPEARSLMNDCIVDFAKNHKNVTHLHVWLADGTNNHCECDECRKMTASDWYVILMNELDEKLTAEGLDTRIVFISYVDTTWAPTVQRLKNESRFLLLFAPIYRSYAYSVPNGRGKTTIEPYKRNKNVFPPDLASSLDYFDEWKKVWGGSSVAFEYHFWRHQFYDVSGLELARTILEDVKEYKRSGIDGVIACGSQRSFFPNGLLFNLFARSMYDTSLGYDEIVDDYYFHAYGEEYEQVKNYLKKLYTHLPFEYFSRDAIRGKKEGHRDPEMAKKIARIRDITKDGRELISALNTSGDSVREVAYGLLRMHADYCDLLSDWMGAMARGDLNVLPELYEKFRKEVGKYEAEFETYMDHQLCFSELIWTQREEISRSGADVTIL